ncbi:MAG: glycerol-3-phosphate 1-O-acyltransferase PlsY [Magnetococcales bacterium]|nr:glycerol-3-phosphate 1-O-acyltransferase PlsY [Magnetococcales bacterium]
MDLIWMGWVLGAYLLGAVPFGLLVAQLHGVRDLRQRGSCNIGATNVLRLAGKRAGIMALLLDMAKGGIPVVAARMVEGEGDLLLPAMALAAFFGHLFPIYLKFKGGKGVATALGIHLAWVFWAGAAALLIWLGTAFLFRYSSVAALVAFALLPVLLFFGGTQSAFYVSIVITLLVFVRHRANIQRLIQGQEPKIGRKGAS